MMALPAATAVTSPDGLTVAAALFEVVQVRSVTAPPVTFTTAFSCAVVPAMRAAGGDVRVTERTAGLGSTVTFVLPLLVLSKVEVAVIVVVPTVRPVTFPSVATVAIAGLEEVHVTA